MTETIESFETYRTYLFSVAYRMTGSAMDAEDLIQETYLRYQALTPEARADIVSLKAYLTTIISRLALNQLESARHKREQYLGPWLPEPVSARGGATEASMAGAANPEERMELYESVSIAFLTLLEELPPVERAVFLLRDVFDYEYAEIAEFLGKSEVAVRQAFSRAKKHLADHRPRFTVAPEAQRALLSSFLRAVQGGDMDSLMTMLADDVTVWADGGGKVRGAPIRAVSGVSAVARLSIGTLRFLPEGATGAVEEVNGRPAIVMRGGGVAIAVLAIEFAGGRIAAIRIIANPDKLSHV
jgi:RNA polymerase sigma-70 factor, ECF subfamily